MTDNAHRERACAGDYRTGLSWFQGRPELSLRLIAASGVDRSAGINDVGGGASLLVDYLLETGYPPVALQTVMFRLISRILARLPRGRLEP